jgi:hypothetical protein
MPSYTPLSPVSAAIFAALNVAAVTSLAPGGVADDIAQASAFPFVLYTVSEAQQLGGFGTKPGAGALPEIEVQIHVFSEYGGFAEAQAVMAQVLKLLADPPAVAGYSSWAIFHDSTTPFSDQIVGGVKVKELVAMLRLYVEEQP